MSDKVYSGLLAGLLPPGPAWTTEPNSNLTKLLKGLSGELERVDDQAGGLVLEANPLTMSTMLDIRYTEAGLPDLCKGKPDEDSEQQAEVIGKWAARGGQSIAYFYELADKYGFDIDINEYEIFKIEHQGIETLGLDSEYAFSWEINYVDAQQIYFRAGENKADDRLEVAKAIGINCIFGKLKPAHTNIIYTAWENGIDMLYRPLINYNFQDMAELLPSGMTFFRASTATRTNISGIIEEVAIDVARFDYDPELLFCKGILNEESVANFCLWNRDLSQATWVKSACTIVPTVNPCPDGAINNVKIIEDNTTSEHAVQCCVGTVIATSTRKTFSGYVKESGRTKFRVEVVDSVTANLFYADFDLSALTAIGGTSGTGTFSYAKIYAVNNGWYRFVLSGIPAAVNSGSLAYVKLSMIKGSLSYLGNGLSGISLWGGQLESKEGATSVIFTGASSVTRFADNYSIDTTTTWWARVQEGTFSMTLFKSFVSTSNNIVIDVDFDINNVHFIRLQNTDVTYYVYSGGPLVASLTKPFTDGQPIRAAIAFKKDDFAISVNGSAVAKDTSGDVPVVSATAYFKLPAFNGHITQFVFYDQRITDDYLQELATLG